MVQGAKDTGDSGCEVHDGRVGEESIGGVVGANCLNTLNSNQGQAIANMVNGPGGAAYMASHGKK